MKPILFKAKCTDSRYGYEEYYRKEICGYGFNQIVISGKLLECRLQEMYSHDFMDIDPNTLVITTF